VYLINTTTTELKGTFMFTKLRNKKAEKIINRVYPGYEGFIYQWQGCPPLFGITVIYAKLNDTYIEIHTLSFLGYVEMPYAQNISKAEYERAQEGKPHTLKTIKRAIATGVLDKNLITEE
jgi:hypothetical protein